jgi:hypothetical protein
VIGTASAANLDFVIELGAHEIVDAADGFEDAVEPVDVVFDARARSFTPPGSRAIETSRHVWLEATRGQPQRAAVVQEGGPRQ